MEFDLPIDPLLLAVFGFLVVGALVAGTSDRLRVPASLLFLVVGMVAGDDVLALVRLDNPALVQNLGVVALLIILFEGGLTTKPSDLRRAALPGFVLSNVGVLVTAGVVAGSVRLVLDVDWTTALLLGAVVSSTDAAAVFSLLKRAPLPRRIAAILEVESGANDPFAIVLTLGLLASWQGIAGWRDWLVFGAAQLLGGIAVGIAGEASPRGCCAGSVCRRRPCTRCSRSRSAGRPTQPGPTSARPASWPSTSRV
jgi:potassium/hydrogen antiporter